jgi:hypothetical protein
MDQSRKVCSGKNASPTFVIVMHPTDNTTVDQIADHLQPYLIWLNGLIPRGLNLVEVLVLSDEEYFSSLQSREIIGSPASRLRARSISGRVATARPAGNSAM